MYKEKRKALTKSGEEPEKTKKSTGENYKRDDDAGDDEMGKKRKNDEKHKAGGRIGLKDTHRGDPRMEQNAT